MLALRVQVPIACWRKGQAREYLETEMLPPPATCYGMLLSLIGETDRERHLGARVTAGVFNEPDVSVVLRTLWRIKDRKTLQGNGENAKPDYQQLIVNSDLVVLCDSAEEATKGATLEQRVAQALEQPEQVDRFGGLSLGESTHLINDINQLTELSKPARLYVVDPAGDVTMPVWVDHVGSAGTRYTTGRMQVVRTIPSAHLLPKITA